jgi:predicted RNA-binding Zn-ribbon protein involved in translation (DUF1610 family)
MLLCKIFGHRYKQVFLTSGHFVNSFCERCGDYRTHILQDSSFDCPECGNTITMSHNQGAEGTSYAYFAHKVERLSDLLEETLNGGAPKTVEAATAAADGSETE